MSDSSTRRAKAPRPSQRKARGLGHERRAEILAAAKALFLAEGFETVTTRKLARHAGLSQTGLYLYFDSKEDILDALVHETLYELGRQLRKVAADTPLGPELLPALCRAYIAFGLEHPDEYQLAFMVSHAHKAGRVRDLSRSFEEQPPGLQCFLIFHEQIVRLREAGLLREDDALVATQTAWFGVHGLVSLLIARPHFPWAERQRLIDSLLETLSRGLQACP
jgi:AcrR family transcriptional regulator